MKPFNLEDALNGKPVVTRDGREVTQLHLFKCKSNYPISVVINEVVEVYTADGIYNRRIDDNKNDLFMADKEEPKQESDDVTILKLWAFMILKKLIEKA